MQKIEEAQAKTVSEKNKVILSYMQEQACFETPENVRKRVVKVKELLKKYK